jgi:hypothetical protein
MTNSNVDKKESEFWKQVRSTVRAFTWCHPIQPQLGAHHRWCQGGVQQAWCQRPSQDQVSSSHQGREVRTLIQKKGSCECRVEGGGLDWRLAPRWRRYLSQM